MRQRALLRKCSRQDEEYLEPSYDCPQTGPLHGATSSVTESLLQRSEIDKDKPASFNQMSSCVQMSEVVPPIEPVHSSLIGSHVGDPLEDQALEIATPVLGISSTGCVVASRGS